jgi:BirA family transcriptional regulator, biotin operon repressor / biotin---[acetyl-CoA-carboxylase] ligase
MVTLRPPLSAQALRDSVVGSNRPWRQLDIVDETGSTNADLLARSRAGENVDGVVLIAEHQSAGRGRMGRHWAAAPRAQLLLSVGVDASAVPTERWGWLTLATGIAVVDAVAADTGVRTGLKWPNDVLAGDAKLAGILAEVASPQPVIVLGLGLNVTLRPQEASQPHATSLLELGVADPDRDRLARRLLLELGKRVADWRAESSGKAGLAVDYLDRSTTIGAQVRVMLPGEQELVGTAISVDDQGRLVVASDGESHAISAGDVVHLRRA